MEFLTPRFLDRDHTVGADTGRPRRVPRHPPGLDLHVAKLAQDVLDEGFYGHTGHLGELIGGFQRIGGEPDRPPL
jgi:hypothetical protein